MNILVTSTQWPYYGGAATQAYKTIKYLREKGNNVIGGYFDVKDNANVDPDNIGDIYRINRHTKYNDTWILKLPDTKQETFEPLLKLTGHIISEQQLISYLENFSIKTEELKDPKKRKGSLPKPFRIFIKEKNINWKTAFNWLYNRHAEYKKINVNFTKLIGLSFNDKYTNNKSYARDYEYIKNIKGHDWKPDLIIAYNYLAPIYSKEIFPDVPVYFIVVGIPEITLGENSLINNSISAVKFLEDSLYQDKNYLKGYNSVEKSCQVSDKIVIPPNISFEVFYKLHSKYHHKIIKLDTIYPIYRSLLTDKEINFQDKTIDIICVASNWKRKVKNLEFCEKIYHALPNLNKVIIGGYSNNSNDLHNSCCKHFEKFPNTTAVCLIKNTEVFEYLKKTKLLIIPSYFESYSIILLEAIAHNCNVITSKNVGSSILLNSEYLCKDVYDINEWTKKIKNLLNKNFINKLEKEPCTSEDIFTNLF